MIDFTVCVIADKLDDDFKAIMRSLMSQKTNNEFHYSLILFDVSDNYSIYDYFNDVCKARNYVCIRSHIRNLAVLKNYAFRVSDAKFIIFLGYNCLPGETWLLSFYTAIKEKPNSVILHGPVIPRGSDRCATFFKTLLYRHCIDIRDNFAVRRDVFGKNEILFELSYPYSGYESAIFFKQVKIRNKVITPCHRAVVKGLFFLGFTFRDLRRYFYAEGSYLFFVESKNGACMDCGLYLLALMGFVFGLMILPFILLFMLLGKNFSWVLFRSFCHTIGAIRAIRQPWYYPMHVFSGDRQQFLSRKNDVHYFDFPGIQNISKKPKHICVCIATYKRPRLLGCILDAIAKQETFNLFKYSIIVVDNDADASANGVVNNFSIKYKHVSHSYFVEPIKNISLARNRCIDNARGEYLVFIDDDEIVGDDWLLHHFLTIYITGVDAVSGNVFFSSNPQCSSFITQLLVYLYPRYYCAATGMQMLGTNNSMFKRDLFDDHKVRFDPKFGLTGGEDSVLTFRLRSAGRLFSWSAHAEAKEYIDCRERNLFWFFRRFFRYGITYSSMHMEVLGVRGIPFVVLLFFHVLCRSLLDLPLFFVRVDVRSNYIFRTIYLFGAISYFFGVRVKCYET
jgi:succinoglycan biosynthesis protein ExoM